MVDLATARWKWFLQMIFHISECEVEACVYIGTCMPGTGRMVEGGVGSLKREKRVRV